MKKPHGKDRRRHLDHEEAAVWQHTASSIEPLKRAKSRVHASDELDDDMPARPRVKGGSHEGAHEKAATEKAAKTAGKSAVSTPAAPPRKAAPPIVEFDRKKAKRLRSGRTEIEARIDLHGLRQDEAHGTLRAFLHRAQNRGLRWVLVITGKGKIADRDDDAPFDMTRVRDRGVLKRNVPRWLEEPDLRPLVISYTTAAIEHGGDGALYVHLRKNA
ncbi:MAG: Smr/MutS family protein [Hyphomicrobium sp.]